MNTKSLFVVEKFARLVPVYPSKSNLRYDVQLPAGTVALLEHNEFGYFRFANLSGRVTFVNLTSLGKLYELYVAAGEEVCIADPNFPSKLLVPQDGIDREPVTTCNSAPKNVIMVKSKFERRQMLTREQLLICANDGNARRLLKSARREIAKAPPLHKYTVSQKSQSN